jgi:hypothetical protein
MIDLMKLSEGERPRVILLEIIRPAMQVLKNDLGFKGAIDFNVERLLLTICGQEAQFKWRAQLDSQGRENPNGPALGLLQFEKGTMSSRGGVSGVMLHASSKALLMAACNYAHIPFENTSIWRAQRTNDLFAFITGRLLLFTDPFAVPNKVQDGWECYAKRLWRPGKPHPDKWPGYWNTATAVCEAHR